MEKTWKMENTENLQNGKQCGEFGKWELLKICKIKNIEDLQVGKH